MGICRRIYNTINLARPFKNYRARDKTACSCESFSSNDIVLLASLEKKHSATIPSAKRFTKHNMPHVRELSFFAEAQRNHLGQIIVEDKEYVRP
jgi:hypothetical protein